MDHLRVDRFHIVGTAAGGIVALDFAVSFPQRLRSLVLANSIGGVQDPEYLELGNRLRPAPQFNALPPEFRELGPSYRAANPAAPNVGRSWSARIEARDRRSPAQTMRSRLTFSSLETIKVPTLLLTGDADLYAPPAVLRLFAARISGSESSHRARGRPLGVLGAARDLQPDGLGVHPQALAYLAPLQFSSRVARRAGNMLRQRTMRAARLPRQWGNRIEGPKSAATRGVAHVTDTTRDEALRRGRAVRRAACSGPVHRNDEVARGR